MTRQQRSEHTRKRLVRAAAELFDRDGYDRATMENISAAAGVTKGALYFHYPSKQEIAEAVQAEAIGKLEALVAELAAAHGSPMQALIDLNHEVVRWLREETTVRASFRIDRDTGRPSGHIRDFCGSWLAATEWLLHGARNQEDLAAHVRIEPAATLLVGVCLGIEFLRWNNSPGSDVRGDLPEVWELLLPNLVGDRVGTLRLTGSEN